MAILGSFPPPFGGVANHVARLIPLLVNEAISYRVYNAVSNSSRPPDVIAVRRSRSLWLLQFLLSCRESSVLLLSDRLVVWLFASVLLGLRGKAVGVRLRNSVSIEIARKGGIQRRFLAWVLRRMDLVVCVSSELFENCLRLGVSPSRLVHAPGFLPPSATCLSTENVDAEVLKFGAGGSPLLVANGKIKNYLGVDLYGLDLIVEMAGHLKPDYPQIRVIVCFWDFSESERVELERLRARAKELHVDDAIVFNTNSGVFLPVLQLADVFIRPTATDGDANSIREAIALGVPAVASDVTKRPEGCVTHRNRDIGDLVAKVRDQLCKPKVAESPRELRIDKDQFRAISAYISALRLFSESGK